MRVRNKQRAAGLILVGVAAITGVQIGRYHARADALAAATGFSGERAFGGLRELVALALALQVLRLFGGHESTLGGSSAQPVRILGMTRLWPRRRWVTFP